VSSEETMAHGAVEPWRKSFLSAYCCCQNDKSAKPGNLQNNNVFFGNRGPLDGKVMSGACSSLHNVAVTLNDV
jgi:hypothetical protein